ncbi:PREDICTED: transmembrane protein 252 [Galeopterus variegatus]|uniref:Transmembrane protein 252 n=1 Tax=Galeopterus variegatus TaxID=482537 RepID=A0ABM0RS24_GALVR|nr:PREDICTED: transmembrane protein 252 [Galeopterus variegatus]
MQNRTSLILCALAVLMGFLMVCLGALFLSTGSAFNCQGSLIVSYWLLPLGFVILLSGICWSTYHQASESKRMFSHVLTQHLAHGALPPATVDRPDFYPPAYEESLDAEKQTCPAEGEASDIPPPLYTETDLEFQDENHTHPKAPPSYEESIADLVAAAALEDAERQSPECPRQGRLTCTPDVPSQEAAAGNKGRRGTVGGKAMPETLPENSPRGCCV